MLPSNHSDAMKMKRESSKFFVQEDRLFRRDFNQAPMICLSVDEVSRALKEVLAEVCYEHQRG